MPIAPTDLLYKLSTKVGAAGDSTAGTPAASLGKYISTTLITDATLSNLFDTITSVENENLDVEYRCLFIHNNHASLSLTNTVVWVESEIPAGAVAAIAVDTTAASAKGSASAQAVEVANENTAPAGQTFSAPTTKGTGLIIGTLGPGQVKGIWVRRTATDSPALALDGVTIRVEGDTPP